nr:unnamed protein product [Spirometra erinaceieuropaei]
MFHNLYRTISKVVLANRSAFLKAKLRFGIRSGISTLRTSPLLCRIAAGTWHASSANSSVVRKMSKWIISSSTYKRPNSMFRAYSNIAAVVRYCNDFAPPNSGVINGIEASYKRVEPMRPQFPKHMRLSSLKPQSFLSNGCFGAVWSAKYSAAKELGVRCDLAVKVLYNFYAATSEDEKVGVTGSSLLTNGHKVSSIPVDWHLLNKQVRRECGLRPASYHPNIVPVWKKFFDKAPPASKPFDSSSASDVSSMHSWQKAEQFREGFGGRPITCYLVMPKFEATLDDIFNHNWHPPITTTTAMRSSPPRHPSSSLSVVSNPNYCLPVEEAVPLLAQMFEAVAELERSGVAHRDLKPSNVLVRPRSSWSNITGVLDSAELELANSRLHVALTDFGCAIKTNLGQAKSHSSGDLISHSGNTIFWPPEVARHFANHTGGINPEQYSRADLWSAATIAYQVFGGRNPILTNDFIIPQTQVTWFDITHPAQLMRS